MRTLLKSVIPNALIPSRKTRGVAFAAGGMLALLGGRKVIGLGLFAKGFYDLEKEWRLAHPEFEGSFRDRWDESCKFYAQTHLDETNRKLHVVGIPIIVSGAVGLLVFPAYRPLWALSASAFTFGWILNFIGHGVYEKNAPAFSDDPLSFMAGPIWDYAQIKKRTQFDDEGAYVDIDGERADVVFLNAQAK